MGASVQGRRIHENPSRNRKQGLGEGRTPSAGEDCAVIMCGGMSVARGTRARGKPTRLSWVVACPWRGEPSAGQAHAAITCGGVSVVRGTERGASPRGYHAWWRVGGEGNRARGKPTRLSCVVACPWRGEPSAGEACAAIMCGGVSVARGTERGASPRGYHGWWCVRGERNRARGKPARLSGNHGRPFRLRG